MTIQKAHIDMMLNFHNIGEYNIYLNNLKKQKIQYNIVSQNTNANFGVNVRLQIQYKDFPLLIDGN